MFDTELVDNLPFNSEPVAAKAVVNSHNEWDLLEEVVVGVIDGATVPSWHIALDATMPSQQRDFFQRHAGQSFPKERIDAARRDLDECVHILEQEGVKVRRPDAVDFRKPFSTPEWQSSGGLYAAMPRDLLIVFGDEIIESPLSWRSRHHEIHAFRRLLKDYFRQGGRWTCAPTPQLSDALYDYDYVEAADDEPARYVLTEFEPVFDAADFMRCGRDIFVQQSHTTNQFGIAWLRQHLGPGYRFHQIELKEKSPMHIDATFVPLAPGKLLINPEKLAKVPDVFKNWDVFTAPPPCTPLDHPMYMSSRWLSMNVLSLDEKRVLIEKGEETLIRDLKRWGFEPIPCSFRSFYSFGGSFHCATLDVRRRGGLQSYF